MNNRFKNNKFKRKIILYIFFWSIFFIQPVQASEFLNELDLKGEFNCIKQLINSLRTIIDDYYSQYSTDDTSHTPIPPRKTISHADDDDEDDEEDSLDRRFRELDEKYYY